MSDDENNMPHGAPVDIDCTQDVWGIGSLPVLDNSMATETSTLDLSSVTKPLAWLKLISTGSVSNVPPDLPKVVEIFSGTTTFGRGASDYQIKLPSLSRNHAVIEDIDFGGGRRLLGVRDLGSRNGTFVNKKRLGKKLKVLEDGDHVRFGDVEFLFTSEATKKSENAVAARISDELQLTLSSRKRKLPSADMSNSVSSGTPIRNGDLQMLPTSSIVPPALSGAKKAIVPDSRSRHSLFFVDSPRASLNVFDDSAENLNNLVSFDRSSKRLVEETFCDVDPDNAEDNEDDNQDDEKIICASGSAELNLNNFKFKDEQNSKSVSASSNSSKRNSLELKDCNFESKLENDRGINLHKSLFLRNNSNEVKESPLVKLIERSSYESISIAESPPADDTVIVSETMSSNENLALMSPYSRNAIFKQPISNAYEKTESSSFEKIVINETCFDQYVTLDNDEMLSADSSNVHEDAAKNEENIIDCIEEEAKEKMDTEVSEYTPKKDIRELDLSPQSSPTSPSMLMLPQNDGKFSDQSEDPLVFPREDKTLDEIDDEGFAREEENSKTGEVDHERGIYEQETLDPLGASISELEHVEKIAEIENVNEKTSEVHVGEMKAKIVEKDAKRVEVTFCDSEEGAFTRPRSSLVEPDFSDGEGDEEASIVTSSQRELAHRTILSINTPMKHRLKNRAAQLKEKRSNKQLYKDATGCEEIPATYDDDAHDTVDPLAALKYDLSAIDTLSKIKVAKAEKSNEFEEIADKAKLTGRGKGAGKKAVKVAKKNNKAEDILLSQELSMPSASSTRIGINPKSNANDASNDEEKPNFTEAVKTENETKNIKLDKDEIKDEFKSQSTEKEIKSQKGTMSSSKKKNAKVSVPEERAKSTISLRQTNRSLRGTRKTNRNASTIEASENSSNESELSKPNSEDKINKTSDTTSVRASRRKAAVSSRKTKMSVAKSDLDGDLDNTEDEVLKTKDEETKQKVIGKGKQKGKMSNVELQLQEKNDIQEKEADLNSDQLEKEKESTKSDQFNSAKASKNSIESKNVHENETSKPEIKPKRSRKTKGKQPKVSEDVDESELIVQKSDQDVNSCEDIRTEALNADETSGRNEIIENDLENDIQYDNEKDDSSRISNIPSRSREKIQPRKNPGGLVVKQEPNTSELEQGQDEDCEVLEIGVKTTRRVVRGRARDTKSSNVAVSKKAVKAEAEEAEPSLTSSRRLVRNSPSKVVSTLEIYSPKSSRKGKRQLNLANDSNSISKSKKSKVTAESSSKGKQSADELEGAVSKPRNNAKSSKSKLDTANKNDSDEEEKLMKPKGGKEDRSKTKMATAVVAGDTKKKGKTASNKRLLETSSSSSVTSEHNCDSPKRSRSSGGQSSSYVMFTGIQDKDLNKYSKQLKSACGAGSVHLGDDVRKCQFLVTDKIRRTRKFLCALARAASIVGVDWVKACVTAHAVVDATGYILKDRENEKKYSIDLAASIAEARENKGVLRGVRIHVTPSVLPPPAEMKDIIESAGGTVLPRMPATVDDNTFVVTTEKDASKMKKDLVSCCRSNEFVLSAIMSQKIDKENHRIDL